MIPDPNQMVEAIRCGDRDAFEELVSVMWGSTVRFAVSLTGDPDQGYDVAQVAFTRLWQARKSLSPTGSIRAWLFQTARNLVVTDYRKKRVRARWADSESKESKARPRTPLEHTEQRELQDAIREAVAGLSPRRRECFTLCHLEGLSYREAAEVMEIRPQSVANYLQAAVADLRIALAPFYQQGFVDGNARGNDRAGDLSAGRDTNRSEG